jgi:hypothetical protein
MIIRINGTPYTYTAPPEISVTDAFHHLTTGETFLGCHNDSFIVEQACNADTVIHWVSMKHPLTRGLYSYAASFGEDLSKPTVLLAKHMTIGLLNDLDAVGGMTLRAGHDALHSLAVMLVR